MLLLYRFRVVGHSMEPTFTQNESLLVSILPYFFMQPKRGDVIVFKQSNGQHFLKRITEIRENEYFLEGDNKNDTIDSKQFGWIKRKQIVGKVIYVIQNSKVKGQN